MSISQRVTLPNTRVSFKAYSFQVYNYMRIFIGMHHRINACEKWLREKPKGKQGSYEADLDICTLCKEGRLKEAMYIWNATVQRGIAVEPTTYGPLLQGCAYTKALEEGKSVHAHLIKSRIEVDIFSENQLLNMYAKCECFEDARHLFDKMRERNVVSWTALISGYVQHGNLGEALKLFHQMQRTGLKPNQFTFGSVLSACAVLGAVKHGKQTHAYTIKTGFESNIFVGNALVTMYAKSNNIDHSHHVFDKMSQRDVVSWNAMIAGYAQTGDDEQALEFVSQMQWAGVKSDQFTFVTAIGVCANVEALQCGKQLHAYTIRNGFESNVFVGNALITLYAKCGRIEAGRQLFDKMPDRTVVSWTAMISGYDQQGHYVEAVELFRRMSQEIKPNRFTFASVLSACAGLAALEQGKQIHAYTITSVVESTAFVANALITMYADCGSIDDARQIYDKMPKRDVVSWNAMIAGYAQHGHGKEVLKLFEQMQHEGTRPDPITFVGVLSACNHVGLVDEGRHYFESMSRDHGIMPGAGHYACMVDLLGRAGCLYEAENLISKMPFEPDASVWGALLGACRIHGNMELGQRAAEHLFELEPENTAPYVLLSNIYATAGKWDDVANVRKLMRNRGLKKKPGCSCIEINHRVHAFVVEDG